MKKTIRRLALLPALALLLSLAPPLASAAYYESFEHPDVRFEDMEALPIDVDAVDAFLARFEADPAGQYEAMLALVDELNTRVTLAEIASSLHGGDEARSSAYEQAQNDCSVALDRVCASVGRALNGPQGEALRALMPPDEADGLADYEPADDDSFDDDAQENALVRQYYLLPDDSAYPDAAAALYLRLVALRQKQAEEAGFDSYADYAYASLYGREYVPEDAKQLHRTVKSHLAPLYVKCELALADCDLPWDDGDIPDQEEILSLLSEHIGHVSPELTEAMDYLRRNGLYRIGNDDELLDLGYTDTLPAYRSAYLFNKVGTRFDAFETTVHEFGHFNAAYHDPTPSLYQYNSIDVAEVQSQGLEMLFLPCLQDILAGDDEQGRAVVEVYVLAYLLDSVVQGCLYDEFEQEVCAAPDMTVAELHALEARLNTEYGLDELYEQEVCWPYISHLFDQPFYYISYAASALPSLQLWVLSQEDRDAAVDAYLKVSAAGTEEWFLDVMDESGLCDITDRGDAVRLAGELESRIGSKLEQLPAFSVFDLVLSAVCILVVLVLLATVAILVVRRRKMRRAAVSREPWEL